MTDIIRSEFNALNPIERMALVREGKHNVVNDPPAPKVERPEGSITRAWFTGLSHKGKRLALAAGTVITDE